MIHLRREAGAILRLAGPLMVAQGGFMVMGVVDSLVVGRVGALDMAAVALGNGLISVVIVFGIGVGMGVEPLIGQAFGAGRTDDARAWLWQGTWLVLAMTPPMIGLSIGMMYLLEPIGISPAMSARTIDYMWARMASVPFAALSVVTRSYLTNVGRAQPALWASLLANVLNLGLDLVLVLGLFGLPALGAMGVGWATCACFLLICVVHFVAIGRVGFVALAADKVRQVFAVGWPIGLQLMMEVGVFAAVGALIGRYGDVELAAHQVALSLASVPFMCAVGIANATTARVGFHIGADRALEARHAGFLGIGIGGLFMALTGLAFLIFDLELARAFTDEAPVYELGADLLRIAGVFAVADGVQAVSAGALRGAGDTKSAFWVNFAAHWLVGLPVAVGLVTWFDLGVHGFWWGLTLGLGLVAVVLSARFHVLMRGGVAKLEAA